MGRCELLAFFIIAFVLAISLQQAYALKCWTCSSDNKRARNQFCLEQLDERIIDAVDRDLSYKECPYVANQVAYCRKLTQIVENKQVYSRSCYWLPHYVPTDKCFDNTPLPSFVRNVHCELCNSDGCNGNRNDTGNAPGNYVTSPSYAPVNGHVNHPTNNPTNQPANNPINQPPTNNPTNNHTNTPVHTAGIGTVSSPDSSTKNDSNKGSGNGATQYGPIALLVIIPVAVARSFNLNQ